MHISLSIQKRRKQEDLSCRCSQQETPKGCEFQPFTDRIRVRGTIQEGPVELMGQHQSVPVSSDDDVEVMKENCHEKGRKTGRHDKIKGNFQETCDCHSDGGG